MSIVKKVILITITSLVQVNTFAQSSLGADIQIYSPTGGMNKNISGTPAGMSLRFLRNTSDKWSFGGEMGIAMYSNKTYETKIDSKDIEIDEEDCFWTIHGVAQRTLYNTDAIRIYGEGRVGVTTFFSSKIAPEENTSKYNEFKFHGTALNFGLGSGITLNTGQIFKGNEGSFNIDLGVNMHSGTKTNYRNINQDNAALEDLNEGNHKSLTHYIAYRFGILVEL